MSVINRLYPFPGESLESLLARVWRANYYPPSGRAWRSALPPDLPTPADLVSDRAHLAALAAFTGLAPAQVRACTLHRFAPSYLWPEDVAATARVEGDDPPRPHWRSVDQQPFVDARGRLCPSCWREQAVVLLPWALRHITTCPTHAILLLDHCDGCGKRLRLDPLQGACQSCGRPYGQMQAPSVQGHALSTAAGTAMWSVVGCGPPFPPRALRLPAAHPLRRLHPATILLIVWLTMAAPGWHWPPVDGLPAPEEGCGWSLSGAIEAWTRIWPWPLDADTRPLPTVAQTHAALLITWRHLLQEPSVYADLDAFHAHAEEIRAVKRRTAQVLAPEGSEPVWSWLQEGWLPPSLQARMQQEESIYQQLWAQASPWVWRDGWRARRPPLLLPHDAARRLRLGAYALRRLSSIAAATAQRQREAPWVGTPIWWHDADADSVGPLELEAAATRCGIDPGEVIALVAAGFLVARSGPLVDRSPCYRFTRADLQRFLAAAAPYRPPPDPRLPCILITLAGALRLLTPAGVRVPQVLAAIAADELHAFWTASPGDSLAALWLARDDVLRYGALAGRDLQQSLHSASAVRRSLQATPATLQRLYRRGLLVPVRDATDRTTIRWWYDAHSVALFAWAYPTDREAAELLGATTRAVRSLVAQRRLIPVTGPTLDGSRRYRVTRVDVYWLRDGGFSDAALRDILAHRG